CALIFSCYSDSCYDPPHLQSFPTRRSSDLRALHLVRPGRLARGSRGDSAASTCVQNLIGIPRCCWWPVSTTGTSLAIACTPRRLTCSGGSYQAGKLSSWQAIKLPCLHAFMPSCRHAVMPSCRHAVMPSCRNASLLTFSHRVALAKAIRCCSTQTSADN